jgi:photoactive yellow protein
LKKTPRYVTSWLGLKAIGAELVVDSGVDLLSFESPNIAREVEKLSSAELDSLAFGVIGLDANDVVRVFNQAEQVNSGFGHRTTLGKLFFVDIAPCMDNGYFKGRIDRARKTGALDISFTFVGDFEDRDRELAVRVQATSDGGVWIFHKRNTVD